MVGMSRRAVLGGVGAAAAAGPAAVAASAVEGATGHALGGMGAMGTAFDLRTGWKAAHVDVATAAIRERVERRQQLAAGHRIGGLDPSVACLRSMSPTARARMQMRLDDQARTLLENLWNQMFAERGQMASTQEQLP